METTLRNLTDGHSVVLTGPSQKQLRYTKGDRVVRLDDDSALIPRTAQKEVLWLLLSEHGNIVSHDRIADEINRTGRGNNFDDPKSRAARFINLLREDLSSGTKDLEGLIRNVRGAGYTINGRWKKPIAVRLTDRTSVEFIDALNNVVADCIDHVNVHPIVRCQNGLQYVEFDRQFALQKYEVLDSMLWNVVKTLSVSVKYSELVALKPHFQELASYILYWRFGDGLTDEKWKLDYREEIVTKANMLSDLIEGLARKAQMAG